MRRLFVSLLASVAIATVLAAGCSQPAPTPATTKAPAAQQPTAAPPKVEYPTKGKPITYIVPYAAGGGSDLQSRLLAPVLEKQLGVPVQVVNFAGAASQVGLTELTKAKPDGHTISWFATPAGLLTYLDPEKKAVFGRKDFQPVALLAQEPVTWAVRSDSPFKTLKELVDAAKERPQKIAAGNTGWVGESHLATLLFEQKSGAKFNSVDFDSAGPQITALMGGHIEVLIVSLSNVRPLIKAGQIRMLGIMAPEQSKFTPGVKTFREQGYDIDFSGTRGIVAPGGTPKEIVTTLSGVFKKALEDEQIKQKMDELGLPLTYMDSDKYTSFWNERETETKTLLEQAKKQQK